VGGDEEVVVIESGNTDYHDHQDFPGYCKSWLIMVIMVICVLFVYVANTLGVSFERSLDSASLRSG